MMTRIRKILFNKYTLSILVFALWMMFFDDKDVMLMKKRSDKLDDLRKSEQHLEAQIAETREELKMLTTDAKSIERYAREKYYMKKDNEDIFILTPGN